ncbi:hypothetical protein [Chondrinema litorale]|uniref:hypothetical protein n=1 Tax=Chondrinema litorale TaxID=2994555 RepID=UPI0025438233|nr:hypothetical protein [Chondrinema litorale]UZR99277.1 hypothetical protein OQ292_35435 [Chondrinema litorale]
MNLTSIKKQLGKYALELITVAFGVFLGMYVSEWKAQQKVNKNVNKSLSYILEELETNKASLEKSYQYHQQISVSIDSLKSKLTEQDMFLPYISNDKFHHMSIEGWQGIVITNSEDIAFESSKITGTLQEADIELVHLISKTYKHLDFNAEFGKTILNKMISINSETKVIDVLGTLELLTSDFMNSEKVLLSELEKTIKQLKESFKAKVEHE